jgi:thiosulfate/3-mercaptopyruvate sulfurtransferase
LSALFQQDGMEPDRPIVVLDQDGGAVTAPFMRYCLLDEGFSDVRLLEGGLPAWRAAGFDTETGNGRELDPDSVAWPDSGADGLGRGIFIGYDTFVQRFDHNHTQSIDARGMGNAVFGLPAEAAIPRTHRIPYGEIVEDGLWTSFKDAQSLARLFNAQGVQAGAPIMTHCHFGMAASNMMTALELAGYPRGHIYAGGLIDYVTKSGLVYRPAAG